MIDPDTAERLRAGLADLQEMVRRDADIPDAAMGDDIGRIIYEMDGE